MISRIADMENKRIPGRNASHATAWVLVACLTTGFLCFAFSTNVKAGFDSSLIQAMDKTVQCGKCRITVLGIYCWRDWMPIVTKPGPDGGTPLYASVRLTLDNSAGDATELAFRAAIVDSKGQSYPVSFEIRPAARPFTDDISKSFRISGIAKDSAIVPTFRDSWNGKLNGGEIREIGIAAVDGPYLPAGSRVHVLMECTDKTGNTVVITTPDVRIERID
jgi:hypothetical protein